MFGCLGLGRNGYVDCDPLASREAAELFVRSLPLDDPLKTLRALREAISIAADRPDPNAEQLAVLFALDARTERLRAELLHNSVERGLRCWPPENTVWQALLDLSVAFGRAYARFLRLTSENPTSKGWVGHARRTLVQFLRHRQVESLFSLLRYEQLSPARWRELHDAYSFGDQSGP